MPGLGDPTIARRASRQLPVFRPILLWTKLADEGLIERTEELHRGCLQQEAHYSCCPSRSLQEVAKARGLAEGLQV